MNTGHKDSGTRVLVIKLSSLGDLFHAIPAVHNLRVGLDASIDWVTQPAYVEVVKCFTDVDRVIRFPRDGFFSQFATFAGQLRRHEYDYVVDLQGLLKSGIVARMARGKRRIGPSFHREGSSMFYSEIAGECNKARHAVEENLDIIRHLGLDMLDVEFPVEFPNRNMDVLSKRVAMIPSSRWQTKNWPAESFAAVGRILRERAAVHLFLFGSAADESCCAQITDTAGGECENLAGKTSLVEMGSYLSKMDLVISNDSGPLHMAAAIGTPVLAMYGPTDPRRTGPHGDLHRVISAPVSCRPCFDRTCKQGAAQCMADISVEAVAEAALEMLGCGSA